MQAMIQNILNLDVRRRPVYMVPNFLMGITVVFTAESNLTDNLIGKKLAPGVLKEFLSAVFHPQKPPRLIPPRKSRGLAR